MNGKRAKQLRREAAWIQDGDVSYVEKLHRRKVRLIETDAKGIHSIIEREIIKVQILMGRCTRMVYQTLKRIRRVSEKA